LLASLEGYSRDGEAVHETGSSVEPDCVELSTGL